MNKRKGSKKEQGPKIWELRTGANREKEKGQRGRESDRCDEGCRVKVKRRKREETGRKEKCEGMERAFMAR
jgi:hypothetical protein